MKHIIIKFYSGSRIKTVNGTILEENERFIKCLVGKTIYTLDKDTDYVSFISGLVLQKEYVKEWYYV